MEKLIKVLILQNKKPHCFFLINQNSNGQRTFKKSNHRRHKNGI